jgi:hypothetical protein
MNDLVSQARNLVQRRLSSPRPQAPSPPLPRALSAELRFREYEASDRATLLDLLAGGRAPSYRRRKEAIFDWQFGANPHADGRAPFLVGTLDGEIVAVNGFMPALTRYQDERIQACWSCDTYVASKLRGYGVGKKLIERVSRHAPVMLGYGISDMSDPIFHQQAWALHPTAWSLFFHAREPGFEGALKNLCSQAAQRIHRLHRSRLHLDITRHEEDFGPDVDALWERMAPSYFSAVQRDANYLNWKYRRHPFQRYAWYAAREKGRLQGLLVARHGVRTSVLVDYCGPASDVELMSALVAEATADLAERGTTRVLCEGTHPPLRAALERAGYVGSRSRPRFRVRTNLAGDVHPVEGWFLMPGDSDGEMLGSPVAVPASSGEARPAPVG